eukprot:111145-Hanusia_phi.AAC.2
MRQAPDAVKIDRSLRPKKIKFVAEGSTTTNYEDVGHCCRFESWIEPAKQKESETTRLRSSELWRSGVVLRESSKQFNPHEIVGTGL